MGVQDFFSAVQGQARSERTWKVPMLHCVFLAARRSLPLAQSTEVPFQVPVRPSRALPKPLSAVPDGAQQHTHTHTKRACQSNPGTKETMAEKRKKKEKLN